MKKVFLFSTFYLLFSVQAAQAASLYISPGSGSFSVGSTFNVTVRTDTQGQAVNTAEVNLTFSTDTLELVRVSASPTFYLQAPGSPSKTAGSAYFGGGLPSPGYNGASGIVGTMTFRALREGTASVSITNGKVLLNDGSGTDALETTAGARYSIVPAPVGTPELISGTHIDQEQWYGKNTVDLSWSRPAGAYGFSFELDQNPETIPDNVLDTTITTIKTYPDLKDGIWYFHIKARRQPSGAAFGNTQHFRIQVDTTPPEPFQVRLVGQADLNDVSRTPTIEFTAADEVSGIDHYDISVDGGVVESGLASNPYSFEKLSQGPHIITVTAFDRAGNSREASLPIVVTGPVSVTGFLFQAVQLPLYVFLIILAVIILLLFLALRMGGRRRVYAPVDEGIKNLQEEVDESLEKLKQQINSKLLNLFEKSSEELFEREEETVKQISKGISKTRRKIDKNLAKVRNKRFPRKIIVRKMID